MEFLITAHVETQPEIIQSLTMENLNQYCAEIETILHVHNEHSADIYCLWGEFTIHRQVINGGVRFSMPQCPNALAWTITTGFAPAPEKIVIHATINCTEHDVDFIESIQDFMQAWKQGLEQHL